MLVTLRKIALTTLVVIAATGAARAADDIIQIGEWRTEPKKSLVCGGEEGQTLVDIATRANDFYKSGGHKDSPEYEAYWSLLEKAIKDRKCFVTEKMRHIPDEIVYVGPESLGKSAKNFKVLGTTIDDSGNKYPGFTMTTLPVRK